jgi:hypothetical protein
VKTEVNLVLGEQRHHNALALVRHAILEIPVVVVDNALHAI